MSAEQLDPRSGLDLCVTARRLILLGMGVAIGGVIIKFLNNGHTEYRTTATNGWVPLELEDDGEAIVLEPVEEPVLVDKS